MIFKKQTLFIFSLMLFFSNQVSMANCQRTALIGDKIIYIDTPDGKKGEGLKKYFKKGTKSYQLLERYQNNLKLNKYSKMTGAVAAGGVLTGLFYQGDEDTRDNIVLISGVVAGINFLIQKTLLYYNEENLQKSINSYNKEGRPLIQLNAFGPKLDNYTISAVWRF